MESRPKPRRTNVAIFMKAWWLRSFGGGDRSPETKHLKRRGKMIKKIGFAIEETCGVEPSGEKIIRTDIIKSEPLKGRKSLIVSARFKCPSCGKTIVIEIQDEAKPNQPAIDWKLKLMQVLDAVGQAEGVWFDPWPGITKEEQAEIEREYAIYDRSAETTMPKNPQPI